MGRGTDKADSETTRPLEGFSRSVDAFGRTIDRIQADYESLEERYAELNAQLAGVNERLQSQLEANQRLTVYLDSLLSMIPTGIIAVDRSGTVRLINKAAAQLLGCNSADVLNCRYADVWPERAADNASATACAAGADPVTSTRREFDHPDGTRRVFAISTVPMTLDPDAGQGGALEVFADLSEHERLHDQIARMRTLAALGEMAATVAHEIRNPLAGMIGFADLLERRSADNAEIADMAAKIQSGAEYLNRVVGRMLEFARDPQISVQPVDWKRFFAITLDQYEETAKRRGASVKLIRKVPETLPTGQADTLCLRQAIWNVLENAEQANAEGAPIAFVAETTVRGGIRLRISDSGRGIAPDVADRVFLPFVTTREKGTGLGLPTARKLIEAHGGEIVIRNRDDAPGAEVIVELPGVAPGTVKPETPTGDQ